MGRLFGTDGARGVANSELTCELAMKIGRATAMVLTDSTHKRPRVLIGMDTRASSEMLEAAISARPLLRRRRCSAPRRRADPRQWRSLFRNISTMRA